MPRHQKSFGKVVSMFFLSFIQFFIIFHLCLGCFDLNIVVEPVVTFYIYKNVLKMVRVYFFYKILI